MKPHAPLCHPVPAELAGERLDKALAAVFELSRGRARELIEQGAVFVGRRRVVRLSQAVQAGELLRADPQFCPPRVAPLADRVLFCDEALLILDKPAGMPTSPTLSGAAGTLLYEARQQRLCPFPPCEVHRLDAPTSGAVAFVRAGPALKNLMAQFQRGEVHKRYLCRVHLRGPAPPDEFSVTTALCQDPRRPQRWMVAPDPARPHARRAETGVRVLARGVEYADLEVRPKTGRTHQIRVHLSSLGLPLWGDHSYGDDEADRRQGTGRLWLHAAGLGLSHPSRGTPIEVRAKVPADMAGFAEPSLI